MGQFQNVLWVLFFVFSTSAGTFFGLSLAGSSGMVAWLSSWQNLVAGYLAVFAGVLTLTGMMIVDVRQSHRHSELMALNLRSDALLIERAAVPGLRMLDVAITEADRLIDLVKIEDIAEFKDRAPLAIKSFNIFNDSLQQLVVHEQFEDAKAVFSPDAFAFLQGVKSLADAFGRVNRELKNAGSGSTNEFDAELMRVHSITVKRETLLRMTKHIRFECAGFRGALGELRSQYQQAGVLLLG